MGDIIIAGLMVGVGGTFAGKLIDTLEAKTRKKRAEEYRQRKAREEAWKKEQKKKALVVAHEDFNQDLKKIS